VYYRNIPNKERANAMNESKRNLLERRVLLLRKAVRNMENRKNVDPKAIYLANAKLDSAKSKLSK
jgi:hypothetical protein